MIGDHLYCNNCKQVYKDIEEIHETRTDMHFKSMCPVCGGWVSVNIEMRLLELNQFKQDKDKSNINHERHILEQAMLKWRSQHGN